MHIENSWSVAAFGDHQEQNGMLQWLLSTLMAPRGVSGCTTAVVQQRAMPEAPGLKAIESWLGAFSIWLMVAAAGNAVEGGA